MPRHPGDIGAVSRDIRDIGANSHRQRGAGGDGTLASAAGGGGGAGGFSDAEEDEIGAARDWPARAVRLLPKWVDSLKERHAMLRVGVARLIVSRVFSAPHDAVLVQAVHASKY